MKILVDADACPVKNEIERAAKRYNIPATLYIDTSHEAVSDYCSIVTVGKGADAVDFVLINSACRGDIVVTQDYGLAAMALARGCYVMHQNSNEYTRENIDGLLNQRHTSAKTRRSGGRLKGSQHKRTAQENERFFEAFEALCRKALHEQSGQND